MDLTLIEIIFTILGFIITSLIPSIFENNLWDSNVPKSFEKFKEQYEPDLDNILNYITEVHEEEVPDEVEVDPVSEANVAEVVETTENYIG